MTVEIAIQNAILKNVDDRTLQISLLSLEWLLKRIFS